MRKIKWLTVITASILTVLPAGIYDCLPAESNQQQNKLPFYIGTYTGQRSKGIYYGALDKITGKIELKGLAAQTVNPSFLAIHPNKKFLYAVNETSNVQGKRQGGLIGFAIDEKTGELKELNQTLSGGTGPCHLAIDKTGHYIVVANYGSGSIACFRINPDGSIGEQTDHIQHTGKGANPRRQEGPHAHYVAFSHNNLYVFVCDLGIDKVMIYKFDPDIGKLAPAEIPSINLSPGSGPRHIAFLGNFAYIINELNSTITSVKIDLSKPDVQILDTISTLPTDFTNANTTAEIVVHPSGDFIYGSNRGHDSIACFRINKETGKLTLIDIVKCGGKTPRNIEITPDGKYLLSANQGSDSITVFRIDNKTGRPEPVDSTIEVGSPVCIVFVNK
jgi:6-phosphogluconolactonase